MAHFAYLGVLGFCLVGSGWLEFALRTRVYRRSLRLTAAIVPVAAIFYVWDIYAVAQSHWRFDPERVTGLVLIGAVPLEELLFFIVVPICAVLTFEAVRSARPDWKLPT